MNQILAWLVVLFACFLETSIVAAEVEFPDFGSATLPQTELLETNTPLEVLMVTGINRYAERALNAARQQRQPSWLVDPADKGEARGRLRKIVGVPTKLETQPILSLAELRSGSDLPWGEAATFTVHHCQWEAFEEVIGEGLIALPKPGHLSPQTPLVTVVPDASFTPEQMFGIQKGLPESSQVARHMASAGCVVFCPLLIDRQTTFSAHPNVRATNLPHREYLYRLSFPFGLHPVGYEVAKISTGIQAIQRHLGSHDRKQALYGEGEGGLVSLVTAALEARTFDVVAIRGYFDQRENVWSEPAYRNFFGQLTEFGDAEIASLIAPGELIIDTGVAHEVDGPPVVAGRRNICSPGTITTPPHAHVLPEYERASVYYQQQKAPQAIALISSATPQAASHAVLDRLGVAPGVPTALDSFAGSDTFHQQRMRRQVHSLVNFTQKVMRRSAFVRRDLWRNVDRSGAGAFEASVDGLRRRIHDELIGRLPPMTSAPHPRTRRILETPECVGYEVILDCYPVNSETPQETEPGVFASGILLLPKDLQPGQRRPVVVFQHGLEGTPQRTIDTDPSLRHFKAYQGVSMQLVKRGFIVYAPQNPYIGQDAFRSIQRKSNPLGLSLFSYIIEQHRQTLRWLADQSFVDAERIAFYGISYGGKTAMRVPSLLVPKGDQPGYCLSICSADYNDWIRKTGSAIDRYSYVYTGEYEIYEWNMAHLANYAELTWLILPRPFMVERGRQDGVAPDDWVGGEFAKAKSHYSHLGIGDRAELEFFNGPHAIHGVGTFAFLHKHLDWPEP